MTSNGCAGQPPVGPLPVWARSGFSPADLAMPHVMGESGNIVAILWATRDALHSPPLHDRSNKILWVSRVPLVAPDPLIIRATLAGSTRTATVSVPARAVDHRPAGARLLDIPSELVRPHRRTQTALRSLIGGVAGRWRADSGEGTKAPASATAPAASGFAVSSPESSILSGPLRDGRRPDPCWMTCVNSCAIRFRPLLVPGA